MCAQAEFWTTMGRASVMMFLVAVFFIGLFWGISKVVK